jgi:hemoglobin
MCEIPANTNEETLKPDAAVDLEIAIERCVEVFYARAIGHPQLGPMFVKAIPNLPEHLRIVRDFWSHALLGTSRYLSSPYNAHTHLPIDFEHFEQWLSLFAEAARETLPAEYAEKAVAKAEHMTKSFKAGLFPFTNADGSPSRTPTA